MEIEQLEQIAAVIVTAGLVAGNFLMFTPWRNGEDPRQRQQQHSAPKNLSVEVQVEGGPAHGEISGMPEQSAHGTNEQHLP